MTEHGNPAKSIRVFTDETRRSPHPAKRAARGIELVEEATTVYTDGSCNKNGDIDASAGSGVYFRDGDQRNAEI